MHERFTAASGILHSHGTTVVHVLKKCKICKATVRCNVLEHLSTAGGGEGGCSGQSVYRLTMCVRPEQEGQSDAASRQTLQKTHRNTLTVSNCQCSTSEKQTPISAALIWWIYIPPLMFSLTWPQQEQNNNFSITCLYITLRPCRILNWVCIRSPSRDFQCRILPD